MAVSLSIKPLAPAMLMLISPTGFGNPAIVVVSVLSKVMSPVASTFAPKASTSSRSFLSALTSAGAAPVAAISCGIYAGQEVLDLDYPEDSEAGVDGNFVMTGGKLIEVQMSAEGSVFSRAQMDGLLDLAEKGVAELSAAQLAAVA